MLEIRSRRWRFVGALLLAACGGEAPAAPPTTTEVTVPTPPPPSSTSTSTASAAVPPPPPSAAPRAQITVPALGLDRHRIAVGTDRACLITGEGDVACFDTSSTPWIAHRLPSFTGATSIAVGHGLTCIVDEDRVVRCAASDGALGIGTVAQPIDGLADADAVAVERDTVCARNTAGGVRCFGRPPRDRGDPRAFDVVLPAPATQIAAADDGLCALLEDGHLFCYGDVGNSTAYFGGVGAPSAVPVERAVAFSMSADHLCVRTQAADEVLCAGAIGDWYYEDVDFEDDERGPVSQLEMPVDAFSSVDGVDAALDLASTADHACARTEDHRVVCWGASYRDGRHEGFVARRASALRDVAELVAGGNAHRGVTCAVSDDRPVCFATARALGRGAPGDGAVAVCDGDVPGDACAELRLARPADGARPPTTAPPDSTTSSTSTSPTSAPSIACTVHDPSGTPLNVRVDPSTHADVVGTLEDGTEVSLDETRGRFRHLSAPIVGWAWSDALSCP